MTTGSVPLEESVAMGQGRRAFGQKRTASVATKLVNDWLQKDKDNSKYWKEQAQHSENANQADAIRVIAERRA